MYLRIVTWNINRRLAAWAYLKSLAPDLALVQEATSPLANGAASDWEGHSVPPATVPSSWLISRERPWGSAVVSYGPALTTVETARSPYSALDVPLLGTHPGCVRLAQAHLPAGSKLTLISAYGLIDAGYAVTTMHRILSDLTPLFDDSRYNGQIVLAGDLNLSTQLAPPHRARHQLVFDRIKDFGLVDCLDKVLGDDRPLPACPCGATACRHIRTHRHNRASHVPWQDDYLFASERLAAKLTACYADSAGAAWDYSDHCPVVAEFAL